MKHDFISNSSGLYFVLTDQHSMRGWKQFDLINEAAEKKSADKESREKLDDGIESDVMDERRRNDAADADAHRRPDRHPFSTESVLKNRLDQNCKESLLKRKILSHVDKH